MAGLKVAKGERLSPHGLRAGFITQAYINGARDEQIMDHTRQKDLRTMRGYVRRAKLITESPAKLLGLQPMAKRRPTKRTSTNKKKLSGAPASGVAVRGRPPRFAHLVPGSPTNQRRERALASLLGPKSRELSDSGCPEAGRAGALAAAEEGGVFGGDFQVGTDGGVVEGEADIVADGGEDFGAGFFALRVLGEFGGDAGFDFGAEGLGLGGAVVFSRPWRM